MPAAKRRRDYDESDVRLGPRDRGSRRARTKDRPTHADARPGRVLTVDRGRYTCLVEEGTPHERVVMAMKARELGRAGIVVGDRVGLVGDTSGDPGSLARVVRVADRVGTLRRTADDNDPIERVIVTGADQLVIVTALAEPEPRPRMVDRCLVAAYDAGLDSLLCLTKADLADPAEFLTLFADLDVPAVVTSRRADGTIEGLEELRARLAGRDSVLVGHSGVGKSTLVNALVPAADRATGAVNVVTGRGRHTSSSALALQLPGPDGQRVGWITDTPGVRSFGLAHVVPAGILDAFPDLLPGEDECPRGCSHDEPDCGLDDFVAGGGAGDNGAGRLESFRRVLRSRLSDD